MMIPFRLEDVNTLPTYLQAWKPVVQSVIELSPLGQGVGYLTIDEKEVFPNRTHRRPGIHVDGGTWASFPWAGVHTGMLIGSNLGGCRAWNQTFVGAPLEHGNCENLENQCDPEAEVDLEPGGIYHFGAMTVHKSLTFTETVERQFLRVSMPSDAPWYQGYTPNPEVQPTGPILPPRPQEYMDYQ